jgi:hypothetical protein
MFLLKVNPFKSVLSVAKSKPIKNKKVPYISVKDFKKESLSFSRQASLKKGGDILSHIKMQYHLRNRA